MSSKLGDGTFTKACIHWSRIVRAEFPLLLLSATTYRFFGRGLLFTDVCLTLRVFMFGVFIYIYFGMGHWEVCCWVCCWVFFLFISPPR